MEKAYDTILLDYVNAEAAKNGGLEPYRYKCACCWEEVHVCAIDSKNQVTHFRHRNGNNRVECERYFGNHNVIINDGFSRRDVRDRVEFYFSSITKIFSISIKFSADEIAKYERIGAIFLVKNTLTDNVIVSKLISCRRFSPDVPEFFSISEFSWEYDVSISNNIKRSYKFFCKDKYTGSWYPSFFKIQEYSDNSNFRAKIVGSQILYTDTYYIVFQRQYMPDFPNNVNISEIIKFNTMGEEFFGLIVKFTSKTLEIEQLLKKFDYELQVKETLIMLWPPSPQIDEKVLIKTRSAYVFSSFEMVEHSNINICSEDIFTYENGVSEILINNQTKIYKKNAEMLLDKDVKTLIDYDLIHVDRETAREYKIKDNDTYLFNHSGVSELSNGISIQLVVESELHHYSFGYLDYIVTAPESVELSGEQILKNILMYYKVEENFDWKNYESLDLSSTAFDYLEICESKGRINSAIKRYIEMGRI